MPSPLLRRAQSEHLRVSPAFVLAFSMDGRPYVAKETEPYIQYWLNERYRTLHSLFSARGGVSAGEATNAYYRLTRTARTPAETTRLQRAIADMRSVGVLIGTSDDVSRYTTAIVDDYVAHRPFPTELVDLMVNSARITNSSRVLDLAGGPGDLALALARTSDDVSLMELSRAFVNAARRRAKALDRHLTAIHESCNRLVYRDDDFDVVTVSQALHWLDDVMIARGLSRVLRPGGSFFVVHSSIQVADEHPLASVIGRHSVFGHKPDVTFADEVGALQRRLTLLFDAIDAPDVHRVDLSRRDDGPGRNGHIVPVAMSLFEQRRPFDLGYVRGFLTDAHIASIGQDPVAFRTMLAERAASASTGDMMGTHHWAVLQFQRGGQRLPAAAVPGAARSISFEPATAVAQGR